MKASELDKLLNESLNYIRRHRGQIMLGGQGFSDVPSFSGFKAKAPCNDSALEAGDLEARAIGRLAVYCINRAAIPDTPMIGFWFVKGRVMGLKTSSDWDEFGLDGEYDGTDVLEHLEVVIQHLKTWSPVIVATEGVDPYLDDLVKIRRYSVMRFPAEADEWITFAEASRRFGMAERTLKNLMYADSIRALNDDYGEPLLSSRSIEFFKDAVKAKQQERARKLNEKRSYINELKAA